MGPSPLFSVRRQNVAPLRGAADASTAGAKTPQSAPHLHFLIFCQETCPSPKLQQGPDIRRRPGPCFTNRSPSSSCRHNGASAAAEDVFLLFPARPGSPTRGFKTGIRRVFPQTTIPNFFSRNQLRKSNTRASAFRVANDISPEKRSPSPPRRRRARQTSADGGATVPPDRSAHPAPASSRRLSMPAD